MTVPLQTNDGSRRFIKDIMWVAFSQIFIMLLSIITLPALTKTYTSEIFGIWNQINVTVGLLVSIITLQFVTAMVRFLAGEEDKIKRLRSLGSMLSTIIIFAFLVIIVSNIWASDFSLFIFNDSSYGVFVRLAFLWACADALYIFFISYFRARSKIKRLSIIQAVFSASKMGVIVALVVSGLKLEWVITGVIGVDLVFILYVFVVIVREDGFPIPNFTRIREFLTFSLPQIPVSILSWIMSASDRYFITHFQNLSETGIFSSSNSLAGLISLFYFPIGYVLFPVVSKAWEQDRKSDTRVYFEYSTRLFLTLAIPAVIGLSLVSQPLLRVLTTSEYLAGISIVLLLAISQIFWGIFQINEYIVFLAKQTKWLPLITIISAGISIGLNVTLIPYLGITGAAISKIVAYFVLATIVTIWIKKVINYDFNFLYVVKIIIASSLMGVCLYFQKIDGTAGIALDIAIGLSTYFIAMFLMRAFTKQDKQLISQFFKGTRS